MSSTATKKLKRSNDDDAGGLQLPRISLKTNITMTARQVQTRLRPIVLRLLQQEKICEELQGMGDFLDVVVNMSKTDNNKIVKRLTSIYLDARKREAATIEAHGVITDSEYMEAAIEIRNAILYAELESIDNGMEIYKGYVPDFHFPGQLARVVLRRDDRAFWDKLIHLSMEGHPVCGVASPGIGKTATSLYLLQDLVREKGKPVVYTLRTGSGRRDVFYEFIPVINNDNKVEDVTVKVFKILEMDKTRMIESLSDDDGFYFVDPGSYYKGSCVDKRIRARFIMTASNDDRLWNGNDFEKGVAPSTPLFERRSANSKVGTLIFGSLWTDRQVVPAKPFLGRIRDLDDAEVLERFRIVGGSLRDILEFNNDNKITIFKNKVAAALNDLATTTLNGLLNGRFQSAFKHNSPLSVLIGVTPVNEDLTLHRTTLRSDFVEECFARKYLKSSWYKYKFLDEDGNRGNLFESYVRSRFAREAVSFPEKEARRSMPTRPPGAKGNVQKNYVPEAITVGSERTIHRVSNMVEAVRQDTQQKFMFYSKNESEPLIDMIYRVHDGYCAVQATIAKKHGATASKMSELKTALDLKTCETLRIFYAVPKTRYQEFATDPVNPLYNKPDLNNVHIFHISISGAEDDKK